MPVKSGWAGKDCLLKLSDEAASPVFTTIAALKTTSLSINNETIDVTTKDNMPWRTLIEGGIRSMELSASGIWTNASVQNSLQNIALGAAFVANSITYTTIRTFKITFADGDEFVGKFAVTKFERSGNHDGAEEFNVTLTSADVISLTAGAA
jgi:TP901-1 family phage major tail protein